MKALTVITMLLQALVAVVGLALAAGRDRGYGWFIAVGFALYAFCGFARHAGLGVAEAALRLLLFLGTLSIVSAVLWIYRGARGRGGQGTPEPPTEDEPGC